MKYIALTASALALAGCLGDIEASPELQAQANQVRFKPESQVKNCQFITQSSSRQNQNFFGAEVSENFAREKLRLQAASVGANVVTVTDRVFDKGRGGADKTRMTYYADLYKC